MIYADVIVSITHRQLNRPFQYKIPEHLQQVLCIGMSVIIPFGNGDKEITGYVIGLGDKPQVDPSRIKEIRAVAENQVAAENRMIRLARWMAHRYGSTMIQAIRTCMPVKVKTKEGEQVSVRLLLTNPEAQEALETYRAKHQEARARFLEAFLKEDSTVLDKTVLSKNYKITKATLDHFVKEGMVDVNSRQTFRDPLHFFEQREGAEKEIVLSEAQKKAVGQMCGDWDRGERGCYLLYGVTGSGKTEVYLETIRHVVEQGRQAVVLIPEIALTYQVVERFARAFEGRVSVLHSRLTIAERYDQYERAKRGEIDVIIGPRSALFAPFSNIGIFVIDEEHESSYKNEKSPAYHAREVAMYRAKEEGAMVILGSATPSVATFFQASEGEDIRRIDLPSRVSEAKLPEVDVIDMRAELKKGNRGILSLDLIEAIEGAISRGEQVMLFLNRRGYVGTVTCRSCGHTVTCDHCDVSMSYHQGRGLVCHYCGSQKAMPKVCPACGSRHIGGLRAGTEQLEEIVRKTFPGARVLRMDGDTTRGKLDHDKILSAFSRGEGDILVGTQMIVKGHDFPRVTVVAAVLADLSLHEGDYLSGERTFDLLVQAAGRAGRGALPGRMLIQTYRPDHATIQAAAKQDYEAFYREEMVYRRLMKYPPASHLLRIELRGRDEAKLVTASDYLGQQARSFAGKHAIEVLGPTNASIYKKKDIYRKVIYCKNVNYDILIKLKDFLAEYVRINSGFSDLTLLFDFDPLSAS